MKMASWGYCISEFDSSGEPTARPGGGTSAVQGGSETEFAFGRATSEH